MKRHKSFIDFILSPELNSIWQSIWDAFNKYKISYTELAGKFLRIQNGYSEFIFVNLNISSRCWRFWREFS